MKKLARRSILAAAPATLALAAPFLSIGPARAAKHTAPASPAPQIQLARFDGRRWQLFGSLISGQLPA